MKHPNVATIDPTAAGITKGLLGSDPAVGDLATKIGQMQTAGDNFATTPTALDADGTPWMITVRGTSTAFKTYHSRTTRSSRRCSRRPRRASVVAVRDNADLGAVIDQPLEQVPAASTKTWVQSEGLIPQTREFAPGAARGRGLDVTVKNPGVVYGTQVTAGAVNANGTVPLQIYNNWVRWIWVYVQYLGAGNANLSLNANPTWPDTAYSKSYGLLTEVSTILGVPIWNDNSIQVTLDYPEGAHTARILLTGLGSRGDGAGWSQYFPADAYQGQVAPKECMVPGICTGIVTIGFTAFALATDLDEATAADAIKEPVSELVNLKDAIITSITDLGIPVGEAVAVATASGQADRSANGPNIFELLYPLCSAIPKALFQESTAEGWGKVGAAIIGEEAAEKIVDAIPSSARSSACSPWRGTSSRWRRSARSRPSRPG